MGSVLSTSIVLRFSGTHRISRVSFVAGALAAMGGAMGRRENVLCALAFMVAPSPPVRVPSHVPATAPEPAALNSVLITVGHRIQRGAPAVGAVFNETCCSVHDCSSRRRVVVPPA